MDAPLSDPEALVQEALQAMAYADEEIDGALRHGHEVRANTLVQLALFYRLSEAPLAASTHQ